MKGKDREECSAHLQEVDEREWDAEMLRLLLTMTTMLITRSQIKMEQDEIAVVVEEEVG